MFRNLTFFRFPAEVADCLRELAAGTIDGALLDDELGGNALKPVGPLELSSCGWLPPMGWPVGEGPDSPAGRVPMCRSIGDTVHLTLGREQRILPSSAVNAELAKRLQAIEEREGRKPGGRERKRLKDDLLHELLPKALVKPSRLSGYLDLKRGLLVVDTASRKAAEEFASMLRMTLGGFPALPLNAEDPPRAVLTSWLDQRADDDWRVPAGWALGDECELRDAAGSVARLAQQELTSDEVVKHLDAGKQCTRLRLVDGDRLAFTLGEDLVVRKLRFLDGAMDQLEQGEEREDLAAELDARATLLVGEVGALFDVLEQAFRLAKVEG